MKTLFSKLIVLSLSLILVLSLVACGGKDDSASKSEEASQSVSQSTNESATNSVTQSTAQSTAQSASASNEMFKPLQIPYKDIVGQGEVDEEFPVATTPTTVWLVGDSTVCSYKESSEKSKYYYMRNGYGMRIGEYLNSELVTVKNIASSGKSSKSFITAKEEDYNNMKANIKAGDFLIIGFGHNDEKKEDDKFTDPVGGVEEERSFKHSLYYNYAKIAIDAGATPILCTPIVRRSASGVYSGEKIHITTEERVTVPGGQSVVFPGGDYRQAIVDLGKEMGITVVDLTTLTKEYFTGMTNEESMSYFAYQHSKAPDNTHLNAYGAQTVARLLIDAIDKQTNNPLRGYIKAELQEPTTDVVVPLQK